jgi:hypothetical protein
MMGTSEQQTKANAGTDAAQFIKTTASSPATEKFLGKLEVKAHDQPQMSLGHFSAAKRLKGFAIQLLPEPKIKDSIITKIATVGDSDDYELVLHVTNNGNIPLTAQIWEL